MHCGNNGQKIRKTGIQYFTSKYVTIYDLEALGFHG